MTAAVTNETVRAPARTPAEKLTRFIGLLEPLMLLGMGVTVAFIVISVMQPIMDMGQLTGPK